MSKHQQTAEKEELFPHRPWLSRLNLVVNHRWTSRGKTSFWVAAILVIIGVIFYFWRGRTQDVWGNVIADFLVGAVMVFFWQRELRKISFFGAHDVSLLHKSPLNNGASIKEKKFETLRYENIITDIERSLRQRPEKKFFFFLLQGPQQSGKTSFVRYINSEKTDRFQAWEIPYAALKSDSAALEDLFSWICNGDERWDKRRKRILVFHAGDSVKQANYLMEQLRILSVRLKKMVSLSEFSLEADSRPCIFVVQLTGRLPMDAVFSDFHWDNIFNNMLTLNYITPDKMDAELTEEYKNPALPEKERWEYIRMLYLHSLGIPGWYYELKHAKNEGRSGLLTNSFTELFEKRIRVSISFSGLAQFSDENA